MIFTAIKFIKGITGQNTTELHETPQLLEIGQLSEKFEYAGRNMKLQLEKRVNNEVTVVGTIEDIIKVFGFDVATQIESGFRFGRKKGGVIRCNPKSYKYFANKCIYPEKTVNKIKKQLGANKEDNLYFYRPGVFLMSEKETCNLLKKNIHFDGFEKYAKCIIKQQKMLHNVLGEKFDLEYSKFSMLKTLAA